MGRIRVRKSDHGRRAVLRKAGALLAGVGLWRLAGAATGAYPETVAALADAFQRETDAHRRYLAFAGTATQEGYKGIAYMFTAFAMSEGLHARNFKGLVTQLGGQANAAPTAIKPGTTKQNLIAAIDDEIDSIDTLYPRTLERIRPEGYDEATRLVRFAWESEHQHRDLIRKIRRYSPMMFEQVAKAIDQKTGLYFVCQTCGSTLSRVPTPKCPICGGAPAQYLQVPIPG
jgi:rubrerythrin